MAVALSDAADLLLEIHIPGVATELAVGDALQPDLLLSADHVADRAILDRAELGRRNTLRLMIPPGLPKLRRAKQAADMIGAKGRRLSSSPGISP